MLWGGAGAMAAVLLLRFAWSRQRRSVPVNAAAWGLLALTLAAGGRTHGAWGLAVVALIAMGTAFALLAHATLTAPAGKARPSERRAHALPGKGEPLHLGRRIGTFVLALPAALAAALLVALGARVLAGLGGWQEANGNMLAFFLTPIIWALLLFALLMRTDRRGQYLLLALPAAAGGLLLLVEKMA